MKFLEANLLHRKYGVWGTRHLLRIERGEISEKFRLTRADSVLLDSLGGGLAIIEFRSKFDAPPGLAKAHPGGNWTMASAIPYYRCAETVHSPEQTLPLRIDKYRRWLT
jgi:hypothetical protein